MSRIAIQFSTETPNDPITQINCGKSSPRLGGVIDISNYTGLTSFACNSNDVTFITGYGNNENLKTLSFFDNKITGVLEDISKLTQLEKLECYKNQLTGPIPNLQSNTNLKEVNCYENNLSGPIPDLSNLTKLVRFNCYRNDLSGEITDLFNLVNLQTFNCYENRLSGPIPDISTLVKLTSFRCYENGLSGDIPDLTTLTDLRVFNCAGNILTSYAGGLISNTIQVVQIHNNELDTGSVDRILQALVDSGAIGGTLYLGGTNEPPSNLGNDNLDILSQREWNVIIYSPSSDAAIVYRPDTDSV